MKNLINTTKDYCKNNKLFGKIPLTFAPQIAEGLIFAMMSIAGYKAGNAISNKMFGEEKIFANKEIATS